MPNFGRTSRERLATAHPLLQELMQRVVKRRDITILYGHRNEAEQNEAHARGASTKRWPESTHNTLPSMAVDVAPWPIPHNWGDLVHGVTGKARDLAWKERVKFYEVAALARFVWSQMCEERPELATQYRLRCGADWDGDGDYRDQDFDDLPHFELVEVN